ncbi:MAG: TRAP transporter small permease [Proteobacteria bacterium]|nr:TRAP transporter small permease [Pseudomonadota bacterium]
MVKKLQAVDRVVAAIEKLVLLVMVAAIVLLPLAQIILRVVGHGGFPWGHEVVRTLMLWIAFVGASLATAERRHITIDLIDRSLAPKAKAGFNIVVQTIGLLLTGYLAWVAKAYIEMQREFGDTSAILQIPVWMAQVIIPISLVVIAWRMFVLSAEDAHGIVTGELDYLAGPDTEGRLY